MDAERMASAMAKIEQARRMLEEGVRELAAAASLPANDVRPRPMRRPPGESDEVAAARAKRILRAHGFVSTRDK
jgi:hypothetical protein